VLARTAYCNVGNCHRPEKPRSCCASSEVKREHPRSGGRLETAIAGWRAALETLVVGKRDSTPVSYLASIYLSNIRRL